jgi:hypothetical protein
VPDQSSSPADDAAEQERERKRRRVASNPPSPPLSDTSEGAQTRRLRFDQKEINSIGFWAQTGHWPKPDLGFLSIVGRDLTGRVSTQYLVLPYQHADYTGVLRTLGTFMVGHGHTSDESLGVAGREMCRKFMEEGALPPWTTNARQLRRITQVCRMIKVPTKQRSLLLWARYWFHRPSL